MAPGDHGQRRSSRARRRADRQLLPHRSRDRPPVRPGDVPLRQPGRPRPRRRADARPAVPRRRDRARRGRRVRAPTRSRGSELVLLDATGHCPNLSAPGRHDRGHLVVRAADDARRTTTTSSTCTSGRRAGTSRRRPTAPSSGQRDVRGARPDGQRTTWSGARFADLLTPGGRIYHETHCAPMLHAIGSVTPDRAGGRDRRPASGCPVLVNADARARRRRARRRWSAPPSSTPPSAASTSGSCSGPRSGPRRRRPGPACSCARCSRR